MLRLKSAFIATRPWSFIMTAIAITFGAVMAYFLNNTFSPILYVLTLIGAITLHATANILNDYFDSKYEVDTPDAPTARYRPHPIITGFMSPSDLLKLSLLFILITSIIGIYLTIVAGLFVLVLGVIGLILAATYTGPPIKYKYIALGEFAVFVIWGPLMVLGSYYVQTSSISMTVIYTSLPIGILVSAVLLANNLRDIEFDSGRNIKTLPILLGKKRGLLIFDGMILSAYGIALTLFLMGQLYITVLLTLVTLPKAINLLKTFKKEIPDLADPMTAQLVMYFGIVYIIAIILGILLY
jgi:1,4-dihydroxy-2-naphthoate octaprenyltransferase